MFVIIFERSPVIYGPFKTADAATKWAGKNLSDWSNKYAYRIAPLKAP